MMRFKNSVVAFVLIGLSLQAGFSQKVCGKVSAAFSNPQYFSTQNAIITFAAPTGWHLVAGRAGIAYLVKDNDTYQNARVILYMTVEPLRASLESAAKDDIADFESKCQHLTVTTLAPEVILDADCERVTQRFDCSLPKGSYVDLDTKIAFNGALLNIVLSGDNVADLMSNREAYESLLSHVTLVR